MALQGFSSLTAMDNVSICSELLSNLLNAAKSFEDDTAGRLGSNAASACDAITDAVRGFTDCASKTMKGTQLKAKRLCASRDKRLEWQLEEFEAVVALLEGLERHVVCVDTYADFDMIEGSLWTAEQLLTHLRPLPTHASLVIEDDSTVMVSLSRKSRVQLGMDAVRSIVSQLEPVRRGEKRVRIACRDSFGDPVRAVTNSDVRVSLVDPATGWAVSVVTIEEGTVRVTIAHSSDAEDSVTLLVHIDSGVFKVPLQVGCTIQGSYQRTLQARSYSYNAGLALTPDGTVMTVSNAGYTHNVSVINVTSGRCGEFGAKGHGPAEFNTPQKLCFVPNSNNLLVADCANSRVQEVTLMGGHVRSIGEGVLRGQVRGVAAHSNLLAVNVQLCPDGHVFVFDLDTGELIRRFGEEGGAEGKLAGNEGLRFTCDGGHLLIAEAVNHRLSLFTITGEFVRCIGVGTLSGPADVDFASNGDILVADQSKHCIHVYSPDGATHLRSFGRAGNSGGLFKAPVALAVHGKDLYVLDYRSDRVQVFS